MPHYIHCSISKTEFVNEKCILVISSEFKIYIFQKTIDEGQKSNIQSTEFKCFRLIDLDVPPKADALISSCIYGRELLLGTRKGRVFIIDMVRVCEKFGLKLQDYFSDISTSVVHSNWQAPWSLRPRRPRTRILSRSGYQH